MNDYERKIIEIDVSADCQKLVMSVLSVTLIGCLMLVECHATKQIDVIKEQRKTPAKEAAPK